MNTRQASGFTLLEMIISMLIVSAIVLMIYTSFSTVVRTWKKNQAQAAEFRLETIGDRLLQHDWRNLVPYTFSTERGTYKFLYGSHDRLAYVTTHRLGSLRKSGGGLHFTLLLLVEDARAIRLLCYKTDAPEHDLMDLVRLYQSGNNDPEIEDLEAEFMDKALLLKTMDEAEFSFDTKSANEAASNATDDLIDEIVEELELLPLEKWQGLLMPKRIRLSLRRGDAFDWLESDVRFMVGQENSTLSDSQSIPKGQP